MTDLPADAIQHLWPFLLLVGLSATTLVALVKGLLGARTLVREESIEALKTDAGKAAIRAVVSEAVTGMIEPLKDAVAEQRRSAKEQGSRLGALEQWRGKAEALLAQVERHEGRLDAHDRWVVEFGKALKRAGGGDEEGPST
jgi:hypothetical protein